MAAFSFASEVKAHLTIGADLMGYDGTDFTGPKMTATDQKDTDALIFDFGGEKAGAHFQGWYKYEGGDAALNIRSASIWFKPIDMLKITVGDVSVGTYAEQINWWHATAGANISDANGWDHRWSSYSSVEGWGVSCDLNIGNLWINAGIAPGANSLFAKDSYGAYGVIAKYTIMDGLSAAVSWRDEGKDATKLLKVGADYSNGGFYGFVNVIAAWDGAKGGEPVQSADYGWKYGTTVGDFAFGGIAIDNYFKYSTGALTLQASVPVVIRTGEEKIKRVQHVYGWTEPKDDDPYDTNNVEINNPSYLLFDVKASYSLGAATPYIRLTNTECYAPIAFDGSVDFAMDIRPGVDFSIGECSVNVEADFVVGKDLFNFSVPVTFGVSL